MYESNYQNFFLEIHSLFPGCEILLTSGSPAALLVYVGPITDSQENKENKYTPLKEVIRCWNCPLSCGGKGEG